MAAVTQSARSLRSYRKIGDCDQSTKTALLCPPPTSSAPCAIGTASRALAYTARQDVTAPPQVEKVTQALSLETSPVNYMVTKMFKDDRYCYLNNDDDDDSDANNILIVIYYYYYQYSESNINLKNIQ